VVEQQYRYKSLCWRRPRMSESESPDFFLEKRQGICRSFIRRGREPWFCDVIFAPYI
jgi:hypothetical protein